MLGLVVVFVIIEIMFDFWFLLGEILVFKFSFLNEIRKDRVLENVILFFLVYLKVVEK